MYIYMYIYWYSFMFIHWLDFYLFKKMMHSIRHCIKYCIIFFHISSFSFRSLVLHTSNTTIIPSVGIEPTTLGLLDPRSNQLSYEGLILTIPSSSQDHLEHNQIYNTTNKLYVPAQYCNMASILISRIITTSC